MNDLPKCRRLEEIAHGRLVHDLMPMESYVSLGVPLVRDGRLTSGHFAAITRLLPDRSNSNVFPPNYRAYVDWETEQVVAVEALAPLPTTGQIEPLGLFVSDDLAGQWTDEKDELFAQARWDAYHDLEVLGPAYASRDENAASSQLRQHLMATLRHLVTELGLSLYREVNPDFFAWIEGTGPATAAPAAPSTSRFCTNCGAPRAEGRFCTNCGTPFAD